MPQRPSPDFLVPIHSIGSEKVKATHLNQHVGLLLLDPPQNAVFSWGPSFKPQANPQAFLGVLLKTTKNRGFLGGGFGVSIGKAPGFQDIRHGPSARAAMLSGLGPACPLEGPEADQGCDS